MKSANTKLVGRGETPILGLLALVVAIIAVVPAFLALYEDKPAVYYHVRTLHASIPSSLDFQTTIKELQSTGIPGTTIEIALVNQGNAAQNKTEVTVVDLPGPIIEAWSKPSPPLWAKLGSLADNEGKTLFQTIVSDFVTTKVLSLLVGVEYKDKPKDELTVSVFADGKPAIKVDNVAQVPPWSKWDAFVLPLYIFGGSVLLFIFYLLGKNQSIVRFFRGY